MLQICNLSKNFIMHIRSDAEIYGFDRVNFTAHQGELIAITGPSGCGKSSLLKCTLSDVYAYGWTCILYLYGWQHN